MNPEYDVPFPDEDVVLPALRRLSFGGALGHHPDSEDNILNHLSLPTLETLFLRNVAADDLLSFLRRSSPPLKELILGGGPMSRDFA
jgi:hypothetical protein